LHDEQLDLLHDVHSDDEDVNVVPDLTPNPENSFFTSAHPHSGQLTEFEPAETSSSNLLSHLVHLNS